MLIKFATREKQEETDQREKSLMEIFLSPSPTWLLCIELQLVFNNGVCCP